MTTAAAAKAAPRKPDPAPEPPVVPAQQDSPDLASVVAALARITQAALSAVAADIGRGSASRNGALVSLGAHRDDVEALRGFLAAQPAPAYLQEA